MQVILAYQRQSWLARLFGMKVLKLRCTVHERSKLKGVNYAVLDRISLFLRKGVM